MSASKGAFLKKASLFLSGKTTNISQVMGGLGKVAFARLQGKIIKNIPKYNLTKGITEKKYRLICENILKKMPRIDDWLDDSFIKKNKLLNWNETIYKLHNTNDSQNYQSPSYRRLAFDEIFANFLVLSKNRKKVKKLKKNKNFKQKLEKKILTKLPFQLTKVKQECLEFYKAM